MTLRLTPDMLRPRPTKLARRLPGERQQFRELAPTHESVRNLTPSQHLAPDGSITSSRAHEVTKSDPLLLRIKELEAENAALRKQLESQQ
jgi:hypothetical protein